MKMTRIDSFQFGMIMGAICALNTLPTISFVGNVILVMSSVLYVIDFIGKPNKYE
jgi:uncharacterized membrane protein